MSAPTDRMVRIKKSVLDAAFHREREVGIVLAHHGYKVCPKCAKKMTTPKTEGSA